MKVRLIRKGTAALAMVVALMGTGAVVAYATIPNGGVIHACYTTSTGVLRVIDASVTKCAKTQTALAWNVQGIQGIPGPQGVQGAQGIQGNQGVQGVQGPPGVQGPSGVSHGYFQSFTNQDVALSPAYSSVGSISSVPAGSYMIFASVLLDDGLNEPGDSCRIAVNGSVLANSEEHVNLKGGLGNETLVFATSVTGAGNTIEVDCTSSDNTGFANMNLSLLAVDALN
jgi:hypothetical protein